MRAPWTGAMRREFCSCRNGSPATGMPCRPSAERPHTGCCRMAGTWGHEAEHRPMSEHIYALSWAHHVAAAGTAGTLLADGYSCRSQAKLIDGVKLPHPVQALLAAIRDVNNEGRRERIP